MRRLSKLASVIRTKNAGPYIITCDIFFRDDEDYQSVKSSKVIDKELIARLYNVPEEQVISIIFFDEGRAVKINLKRSVPIGDIGDTDVLGAQQHVPLMDIEIP